MNNLEEKLLQLVRENFSEIQVNSIREMLEDNKRLKAENIGLTEAVRKLNLTITELETEKHNLSVKVDSYIGREQNLISREKKCREIELECEKRNRNWDIELIKKELECSKMIAQNQSDLISDVFHSPVYRTWVSGSHAVIKKDGYGNYGTTEHLPFEQQVVQEINKTHTHNVMPTQQNPNVGKTSGDF